MEQSLITRILLKALLATAVYVALLVPVGAIAGDGAESAPTPEAMATEIATTAPVETATTAPTSAPTETATAAPTETATSAPTATATPALPTAPTASPSPAATATAQPAPAATVSPAPAATATPEPKFEQPGKPKVVRSQGQTFTDPVVACLIERDNRGDRNPSASSEDRVCLEAAKKDVKKHKEHADEETGGAQAPEPVAADGTPTIANPSLSIAKPGAAPIGVPNFFIDKFRIPPFLLPIYQAAGTEYGIRWEILAAINEIETDYGRNLNISSAGALGWMQFMPATWRAYGTDANKDGVKDPFNPVDAIFSAARYLKAAGAQTDLRRGIFAYNHADWYVDSVLLRARTIGGLPADFVGSLTGLTQARFPVQATARYAGAVNTGDRKRFEPGTNVAMPVESAVDRTHIDIFAKSGSPVIAVNDGRIVAMGENRELGRFVKLQDSFGNAYTYAHLDEVATTYPAPKAKRITEREVKQELELPQDDPKPTVAASSTTEKAADRKPAARAAAAKRKAADRKPAKRAAAAKRKAARGKAGRAGTQRATAPITKERVAANAAPAAPAVRNKDRLFANPERPRAAAAGGDLQLAADDYRPETGAVLKLNPRDYTPKRMRTGVRVLAGTVLGRVGRTSDELAPHLRFQIRPAGRDAPLIDPKPILDGWKLLESTAIYRAAGRNPFVGPDAEQPTIGQILLMSKQALQRQVLDNPRITIYECGRNDIRVGAIDRRVLATLAFLASSGLKPTVSSLQCGHGYLTSSGNVSAHSVGSAVDIAAINGISIQPGTQGAGSITETTIQRLLTLQGTMKPNQIISLMAFEGADNTLSMSDHGDHIHVGFQPLYDGDSREARRLNSVLKPDQWVKLIDRLAQVDNPEVATVPSKFALKVAPRVSGDD